MNILIPGAGGFAAINVIKTLKKKSLRALKIITTDSNLLSAGFYLADSYYQLPKINDDNFFNRALEVIENENINIIFPTSGFDIIPFSKNKQVLSDIGVCCFFSDNEVIDLCDNKEKFYQKTKNAELFKVGFKTPKYTTSPEEVNFFPVFAKPIRGKGSRDTFLINSKKELNEISKKYYNMIYSEYLPGKEYTIDVLSDLEGNAIVAVPRERTETKAGISYKGKVVNNKFLIESSLKLVEYLGIKGPCCIQVKEDTRGEFKLLEVNPRLGGGSIMTFLAGVNFPELILDIYQGKSIQKEDLEFEELTVLRYYEEIIIKNNK